MSENEETDDQPVQDLNIAADQTTIYEGGNLFTIRIADVLNNEPALRQLLNSHNALNARAAALENEVQTLRLERERNVVQPAVAAVLVLVNVFGVVLLGFCINFLSQSEPPEAARWLLALGMASPINSTASGKCPAPVS